MKFFIFFHIIISNITVFFLYSNAQLFFLRKNIISSYFRSYKFEKLVLSHSYSPIGKYCSTSRQLIANHANGVPSIHPNTVKLEFKMECLQSVSLFRQMTLTPGEVCYIVDYQSRFRTQFKVYKIRFKLVRHLKFYNLSFFFELHANVKKIDINIML